MFAGGAGSLLFFRFKLLDPDRILNRMVGPLGFLFTKQALIVYGLILLMVLYGWRNSDRFLTDRNLLNVLRQAAFLGTLAIGQTLVILMGGIDLSVGSLVKLSVLVAAIGLVAL